MANLLGRAQKGFHDWRKANEVADAFWWILNRERGARRGLGVQIRSVSVDMAKKLEIEPVTDEQARINARAVDLLLKRHRGVLVAQVWSDQILLSFSQDLEVLEGSEEFKKVHKALGTREGDDLVIRTEANRTKIESDPRSINRPRWPGALEGRPAEDVSPEEQKRHAEEQEALQAEIDAHVSAFDGSAPVSGGIETDFTVYSPDGTPIGGTEREAATGFLARVREMARGLFDGGSGSS